MNAVVSHLSALNYLDGCARFNNLPVCFNDNGSDDWAHTRHQLAAFDLSCFVRDSHPIDILIPSRAHLHTPKGFKFHSPGAELPEHSLLDVGGGVLVCSAPLTFVLLCKELPLERCIKLGFYICGTYSKEASARSGIVERQPLATHAELEDYVSRANALRGSRKAKEALKWVLEGSASPQETELALRFFLSAHLIGRPFVPPVMNYEVKLSPEERAIARVGSYRVDVCWPEQGIGFEYNSYAEHSDLHKIGEDERRRLVLLSHGIHVESVTKAQLDDPAQIEMLSRLLEQYGVPHLVG